ncbi:MAG: hypothetical protein GQ526_13360 [Ardenticatenales bacterium]|nr:hypothetical protein [Ardenticatenales bacterium]
MDIERKVTRRQFMLFSVSAAMASILAACAESAPEATVEPAAATATAIPVPEVSSTLGPTWAEMIKAGTLPPPEERIPAIQIAEIESVLRELYDGLEEKPGLCATFNVVGGDEWVQVTENMLNIHWHWDRKVATTLEGALSEILPHCRLMDIDVGSYATYEIERVGVEEMARLVDWVLIEIYGVREEYELSIEMMEM